MKVAFVTHADIFGELNYGGVIEARRHYDLLTQIYGGDNVYAIIVLTTPRDNSNRITYFGRSDDKLSVLWNCIHLRVEMSKKCHKKIADYINNIDVDIALFESSYWYGVAKRLKSNIKTVLFEQNIEKNYAWNRVIHKSILTLPKFFAVWYNEKKMVMNSDSVVALTERDSKLLSTTYKRSANLVLPISFADRFDDSYDSNQVKKSDLLFVGSNFPPNLEGLKWFIDKVMPNTKCKLVVVGKDMEKCSAELTRDNVEVIGTVDDTAPYYYGAKMMVMPIMWGDGMKVKTAEAMMYGKVILASSEALNGYDVDGVPGIYLCDSEEDYINCIKKIDECERYQEQVRQLFIDKYDHKAVINLLKTHLDVL